MANIILNGKTVVTQTGNDEPVLGSNVILTNDSLANATFPAGHVIQVVQNNFADNTVYSGGTVFPSFTEVTEARTSITVKGNNSRIYMMYAIAFGTVSDNMTVWRIKENTTLLPVGNTISPGRAGVGFTGNEHYTPGQYNLLGFNYNYLQQTTSSIGDTLTYYLELSNRGTDAKEIRLNSPQFYTSWGDNNTHTSRSSVILMEIAT